MAKTVAIIATASFSGEVGGAERFYEGLRAALCKQGVQAQIISVAPDESSFEAILESYLQFYDLDLTRFHGIISTKAPAYLTRHSNHVCYLQHTMRTFYDMFEVEFPGANKNAQEQREWIHRLDTAALRSPNIRGVFVIGEEVRNRLLKFNGIDAEVLYQATTLSGFQTGDFDYLFMPGRLHPWKRVDLVIRALSFVNVPIRLMISGAGGEEGRLRQLASGDPRICFLGRISDDELLHYYSNALAVPFVPYREDFGLVAIEAFHSGKPIITCSDSGEPALMADRFGSGMIVDPTPKSVASAIDSLYAAPEHARRMGLKGKLAVAGMNWQSTATRLLDALGLA